MFPAHGGNTVNQQFVYSNGSLRNPNSGFCLDLPESSVNNGTPLITWGCTGGSNQHWYGATL